MRWIVKVLLIFGLLVAFLMIPCKVEPIDISANYGYLDRSGVYPDYPPMPAGYIPVETIKDYVINHLNITNDTILAFTKPYYKPLDPNLTNPIVWKDRTNYNQWINPFYTCDDFTESVLGALNKDISTAAMPIFMTACRKPNGNPHIFLTFWYNNQLFYFEPMTDGYNYIPSDWLIMYIGG